MTNTNRPDALKDLAKLVRKAVKAAGFTASVRCGNTTVSECLSVRVTAMTMGAERAVLRECDDFGGMISDAKAFNNATREAVSAIVAKIVTEIESSRYVTVTSTATETELDDGPVDPADDFNNPGSRFHY